MIHYEHQFKDNTVLKVIDKEYRPAKRDVPMLQFIFRDERGRGMTLEAPLWDGEEIIRPLYDALGKYLGEEPSKKEEPTLGVEDAEIIKIEAIPDEECEKLSDHSIKNPRKCKYRFTDGNICGREFMPKSPRQKYCAICSEANKRGMKLKGRKLDNKMPKVLQEVIVGDSEIEKETE